MNWDDISRPPDDAGFVKTGTHSANTVASTAAGLAEIRHARGFTQRELAARTGLTIRGIRRIEREGACPHHSTALLLAAALGCQVTDLREDR